MTANKKNYFFLILFFYSLYIINIFVVHKSDISADLLKCFLLTYDGGFIRRGLFGHSISSISYYFNLNFVNVIFTSYLLIYSAFFYYFYKLTKNYNKNVLFYFFIFSPLNFLYPLVQLSIPLPVLILTREIFVITFFLFFYYLSLISINRNLIYFVGLGGLILLSFFYELTLFCYPFFLLIYYLFLKENNYKIKHFEIFVAILILILFIFIHLYFYGKNDLDAVFQNVYLKHGVVISLNDQNCTFSWMNQNILEQMPFFREGFKISSIFRYIVYSHPIIILFVFFWNNSEDLRIKLLFLFAISSTAILFIATDWARIVHLIYLFSLFSFLRVFLSKQNIFENMFTGSFLTRINKNILYIFVLLYCSLWTLKQTYWQNHLSYAGVKIIKNTILNLSEIFK